MVPQIGTLVVLLSVMYFLLKHRLSIVQTIFAEYGRIRSIPKTYSARKNGSSLISTISYNLS